MIKPSSTEKFFLRFFVEKELLRTMILNQNATTLYNTINLGQVQIQRLMGQSHSS